MWLLESFALVCCFANIWTTDVDLNHIIQGRSSSNNDHEDGHKTGISRNPYASVGKSFENITARSGDVIGARPDGQCPLPQDCEDYLEYGYRYNAVYRIWPRNRILKGRHIDVYCDMWTDHGGWTVIQRRGNYHRPANYFHKDWAHYKEGFGDVERDFWLGNDNIFALTNQKSYSVRFDLFDVDWNYSYALYDYFYTESEERKYKLTIQDYSGWAGDSMASHNGMNFSTYDQDNDPNPDFNCALLFGGGWWYNNFCHEVNINGFYLPGNTSLPYGVVWRTWKGYYESLEYTEIKIRSKNFRRTTTG